MDLDFRCFSPEESAILASSIAGAISKGLTADETALLGSFISVIGQSMGFISVQKAALEGSSDPTSVIGVPASQRQVTLESYNEEEEN